MQAEIRFQTVRLVKRVLSPWMEEGIISNPEYREIIHQLKHLSEKGRLAPEVPNRVIKRPELAEILGLSLSNLKKLEKEGHINIPILRVGRSIRYRLHDAFRFIDEFQEDCTDS